MSSLTQIVEAIKSEIKVDSEGKGFVSIRGLARLLEIDEKALRYSFQGAEQKPSKLSEMLIEKGFKGAEQKSWSSVGIPDIAVAFITKYYAYKAGRYCSEYAELVDDVFRSMGVRTWFQQSTGYQPPTKQIEPESKINQDYLKDLRNNLKLEQEFGTNRDILRASRKLGKYLSKSLGLEESNDASQPYLKIVKPSIDPRKTKIFLDLLKACKGQPKKVADFRTHSLGRRLDALDLYGERNAKYLRKAGILLLFDDAAKHGYGIFDPVTNIFLPSETVGKV